MIPAQGKFVRLEYAGETLVVSPLFTFRGLTDGDLDSEWQYLLERIDASDVKHVVVDLGQIPYFGSTLLDWMVQMWKRAKGKGGKMAACNPSPIGREILSAARLDTLWSVFPSRDEALQSLAAG